MTTRYTKDHEWVRLDGDIATVGISTYAAEQLGDVVYADSPQPAKRR
jgi:glycine cleavage system H protein